MNQGQNESRTERVKDRIRINQGQNESRTEDEDESRRSTDEEGVCLSRTERMSAPLGVK